MEEYYGAVSHAKVVGEITHLFESAFRTQVTFGQRHFAPSASWRDEYVSTQSGMVEPSRFAVRVHVFEKHVRDRTASSESTGTDGTATKSTLEDRAGRYLGFVALRPEDSLTAQDPDDGYVVEAEVASPSQMQGPRYHLIMTTASSARMGVLPFKSAVYMAPRRREQRSSTCMHLAISQALHLVMSRFGCRPISQREFDAHVWQLRCGKHKKDHPLDPHWPLLKYVGEVNGPAGQEGGAQLLEALNVMEECSVGGFIAHFTAEGRGDKKTAIADAWRCLTDVLANGLPVVLMVNHRLLTESGADLPHAQLVFGMRLMHCHTRLSPYPHWENREDHAELPGEFIGHDVAKGPFFQTPADVLLNAAWESTNVPTIDEKDQKPGINFLVIGHSALKVDLQVVRDFARHYMFSLATQPTPGRALLLEYYTEADLCPEWKGKWEKHETDWRYVSRFLGREELHNRPDMPPLIRAIFPSCDCFWVIEVWHPQENHGMRSNEAPAVPPPVLIWSNASFWQPPGTTSGVQQSGVLHWNFKSGTWVPMQLNS
ncbi:hypothetical protein [Prosthecobacter sp.]|uniref:hypothetical protein n=1 Tax=Prosthecobacter sp. TaxID=1965333 RepID=UPI0037849376